jgi:hypothetical protein
MTDEEKILNEPSNEDLPPKNLSAKEIILRMSKLFTKEEAEELAETFYAEREKRRGEAF